MCKLTKKTKFKSVTIYKVVYKIDNKYYGYFAGVEVKKGSCVSQTEEDAERVGGWFYQSCDSSLYEARMVGRVSGFKSMKHAMRMLGHVDIIERCEKQLTVLKIKLGGEIAQGDASNIGYIFIPDDAVVYAGQEVLAIQDLRLL